MSDTELIYFGATQRIPGDVPFFGFTELKATTTQVHLQLVQDLDSVVMMYLFDFFFPAFLALFCFRLLSNSSSDDKNAKLEYKVLAKVLTSQSRASFKGPIQFCIFD